MARLTMAQAYAYARQAGFDPAAATIMAAIAMGESGLITDRLGDVKLQDSTWGPSVGLAQIRTVKAETGKGTDRDINLLRDPLANMVAAYHISSQGQDFTPWTVYNTGAYRPFLGQASTAAGTTAGGAIVPASLTSWLSNGTSIKALAVQLVIIAAGTTLVILGAYQATGSPKLSGALNLLPAGRAAKALL